MSGAAQIRHLPLRCFDRDVKNRLRDIGEARIAILSDLQYHIERGILKYVSEGRRRPLTGKQSCRVGSVANGC